VAEKSGMAKTIHLDTDVLVDFLRGRPTAVAYVKSHVDEIALSAVVAAELYAGTQETEEVAKLDAFLSLFPIIAVTSELARAAGRLKNKFSASRGIGLADAVIATTAEQEHAKLKTFNVRHYPMFED
jgi:predicted nucleic acid-binding protein